LAGCDELNRSEAVLLIGVLLASAYLMLPLSRTVNAHSAEVVTSHRFPNNNVPRIDGYFDRASEWNTTRMEQVTSTDKVVYYVGHDDKYLYVLEDFVTDEEVYGTDAKGDSGWVYVDLQHDGGSIPRIDDFVIDLEWVDAHRNQYFVWKGDGKGWAKEKTIDGFYWSIEAKSSLSRSPNSQTSHLIYEFRIPLNFSDQLKVPLNFDEKIMIGLRLRVYDHNRQEGVEFPGGSSPLVPDSWANLIFSPVPIPEFPIWLVPTVALISVGGTFCLTRKAKRKQKT